VEPVGPTSPYTTRLIVQRPSDPARFNGTVYVEWLNVSAGIDSAADWGMAHDEMVREGAVWVGVSAQSVGINGIRSVDPARYAALSHPGDSFSYDIFSQAGRAVRDQSATLLGGLAPQHLIADGESQSAFRMTTYIDGVHPLAHVYDGFMVHSSGASVPLSQPPQAPYSPPQGLRIRTDLDVPVFLFETETDLVLFNSAAGRQPDSALLRRWEVAGTAHADMYTLAVGPVDTGDGSAAPALFDLMLHPTNVTPFATCTAPLNAGPQHWVFQAALHALQAWVTDGTLPATAPLLQYDLATRTYSTDAQGNVLGGVRTPQVDAPVARLSGVAPSGGNPFCVLFGTTTPLSAAQVSSLYGSHGGFVSSWVHATNSAVASGWILRADAADVKSSGAASVVGKAVTAGKR
jgi:hypothetical protein